MAAILEARGLRRPRTEDAPKGTLRALFATLLRLLLLVLLASLVTLALLRVGAPPIEQVLAGRGADAETRAQIRRTLGADQSIVAALWHTGMQFASGDLGRSWRTGARIAPELRQRAWRSGWLVFPGLLLGHGLAWIACRYRRGAMALEAMSWCLLAIGMIALAALLQWSLASAGGLQWLPYTVLPIPVFASGSFGVDLVAWLTSMVLPTIALTLFAFAQGYPYLHALYGMTGERAFVRGALARGAQDGARHAKIQAMRGVVGSMVLFRIPMQALAAMLVIETVFGIPGLGEWLHRSALDGDRPVLLVLTVSLVLLLAALRFAEQIWLLRTDPRGLHV